MIVTDPSSDDYNISNEMTGNKKKKKKKNKEQNRTKEIKINRIYGRRKVHNFLIFTIVNLHFCYFFVFAF